MDANDETKTKTMAGLDSFLKRPEERALFNLPVNP
jgi:hypothetical protein